MNSNIILIHQLPVDVLSLISLFLPLFDWLSNDGLSDDVPVRFVSTIGIEDGIRSIILQRYYHNNLLILQGLLNSNQSVDLTDKYLDIWDSNQPRQETTFSWMINSFCDGQQRDDGLERIILSYETQNGESRDRNAIDSYLQYSMKEMETTYGIAVLILSLKGKDTTVRSIDNSNIYGLSKNEVIQLCLRKFDNGHKKVNIFVTTDSSRSRCIDVTFTNPVIAILNKFDSISRAWIASESNNTCVSKMWRAQLQSLYNNDPHRFGLPSDDMFLTSNSMMIMLGSTGRNNIPLFHPIVQIVYMKRLPHVDERWRITISDGSQYYDGVVPDSLNHHVHSGDLKLHSVIRVLDFAKYETTNGFNVFILLEFQFLYHHRYSIGHPINVY